MKWRLKVLIVKSYDIASDCRKRFYKGCQKGIVGEPQEGMYDPCAHHILFKTGLKGRQQDLVKEGQRILREYGIDPIVGPENIVWAPRGVVGQHTTVSLEKVVDGLKCIDDMGGDYEQIVKALKKYGKNASLIK